MGEQHTASKPCLSHRRRHLTLLAPPHPQAQSRVSLPPRYQGWMLKSRSHDGPLRVRGKPTLMDRIRSAIEAMRADPVTQMPRAAMPSRQPDANAPSAAGARTAAQAPDAGCPPFETPSGPLRDRRWFLLKEGSLAWFASDDDYTLHAPPRGAVALAGYIVRACPFAFSASSLAFRTQRETGRKAARMPATVSCLLACAPERTGQPLTDLLHTALVFTAWHCRRETLFTPYVFIAPFHSSELPPELARRPAETRSHLLVVSRSLSPAAATSRSPLSHPRPSHPPLLSLSPLAQQPPLPLPPQVRETYEPGPSGQPALMLLPRASFLRQHGLPEPTAFASKSW